MFSFSIKRQNCGIFSVIDLDESVFPTHCESYVTKFTQVFSPGCFFFSLSGYVESHVACKSAKSSLLSVSTERERGHNSWNNSLRQQKKNQQKSQITFPEQTPFCFRPQNGLLMARSTPFFPYPSPSNPARPFIFRWRWLYSLDWFLLPFLLLQEGRKKAALQLYRLAHTHTPSSPFCSTLLHIPLLHACVCSKKASPVFVRARAKLAYCDVCEFVYIKVIKASDLKEAEKRDSPTQR